MTDTISMGTLTVAAWPSWCMTALDATTTKARSGGSVPAARSPIHCWGRHVDKQIRGGGTCAALSGAVVMRCVRSAHTSSTTCCAGTLQPAAETSANLYTPPKPRPVT